MRGVEDFFKKYFHREMLYKNILLRRYHWLLLQRMLVAPLLAVGGRTLSTASPAMRRYVDALAR